MWLIVVRGFYEELPGGILDEVFFSDGLKMLSGKSKIDCLQDSVSVFIVHFRGAAWDPAGLSFGGSSITQPRAATPRNRRVSQDACFGVDLEWIMAGCPIATRKTAILLAACGEKNSVTSSSKNVRPVAPRR